MVIVEAVLVVVIPVDIVVSVVEVVVMVVVVFRCQKRFNAVQYQIIYKLYYLQLIVYVLVLPKLCISISLMGSCYFYF